MKRNKKSLPWPPVPGTLTIDDPDLEIFRGAWLLLDIRETNSRYELTWLAPDQKIITAPVAKNTDHVKVYESWHQIILPGEIDE